MVTTFSMCPKRGTRQYTDPNVSTSDYFDRVRAAVHDFALLQTRRVVIVGAGMTGSQMAEWLAQCGVGHLRFIDHDTLEVENLARHTLDENYLGQNKARGWQLISQKCQG
jgi:tRNA A37 threonylcarbamoyladenosine dehydratase